MRFDGTPLGDAILGLYARQDAYRLYKRYYEGEHDLQRIVARLRLRNRAFQQMLGDVRENLCPAVVDSLDDRLQIEALDCGSDEATKAFAKILGATRLAKLETFAHRSSMVEGDSYILAWPNPTTGAVVAHAHEGHEMTVVRDPDDPSAIAQAVKVWRVGSGQKVATRMTVYEPGRVTRWIKTNTAQYYVPPSDNRWSSAFTFAGEVGGVGDWQPYEDEQGPSAVVNPFGVVPVVGFHNNGFDSFGTSELRDAIPLQNALNKRLLDSLITGEANGVPQRYISGLDYDLGEDGKPNVDLSNGLWLLPGTDVKVGELAASDVAKSLQAIDDSRMAMARVTGVPAHYFGILQGGWPSGEALKTAESRFAAKVKARQTDFGASWESLAHIMLLMAGQSVDPSAIECKWKDTTPRDEKNHWEVREIQNGLGMSKEELWVEEGWTPDEAKTMLAASVAEGQAFTPAVQVAVPNGSATVKATTPAFQRGGRAPVNA